MVKRVRLARARRTAGHTQESFAEALGVDRSTVARWEAGDHEPSPYIRPTMARLLAVSRDELTELLQLSPSVQVGDAVAIVGHGEPNDHLSSQGDLLLPVVIDGYPRLLRLDVSALVGERVLSMSERVLSMSEAQDDGGRGSALTDHTLRHAGRLDSTLHTVVELSGEDLNRRESSPGASFTAIAFAEPALSALTTLSAADVARAAGSRRIGMTDLEILTDNVAHLRRMDFRYGSGRIRRTCLQLLHHAATTLLHGSYSDSTGRALLTAVAQVARLAASMAADVGRPALAQRYYIEALKLAMNADNRLFAANVLSDMSRLTIQNAAGKRCARQSVALAQTGTTVAGKATPLLRRN